MSDKIGVAIIGSGIFVKEEHLPAVQKCPNLSLKAIYSRSIKSAQSVSEGLSNIDLYSDDTDAKYQNLLSRSDVQAVIIALPIVVQPQFIKDALTASKHVLAEKPLANDVATGKELIDWYHSKPELEKLNFSIAENIRYDTAYAYAATKVSEFGKVLGARVRMHTCIKPDMRYLQTPWRKKPTHQAGFLLDGGVHFIAGIRILLKGGGVKVKKLSAYTTLLQDYLPPIDTVDATFLLSNGKTGSFSVSFGSTFTGAEWSVACDGGTVSLDRSIVKSKPKDGEEQAEDVKYDAAGPKGGPVPVNSVMTEVFHWAQSLKDGKWDERQSAEEGLADLEILEAMVKSGESGGDPVELKYQI